MWRKPGAVAAVWYVGELERRGVHGPNALALWLCRSGSFRIAPVVRKSESYADGLDELPHRWLAS